MTGDGEALRQLEQALAEQMRRGESYERSIGTSAELSNYVLLQAAGLRVSICDRLVRGASLANGLPVEGT